MFVVKTLEILNEAFFFFSSPHFPCDHCKMILRIGKNFETKQLARTMSRVELCVFHSNAININWMNVRCSRVQSLSMVIQANEWLSNGLYLSGDSDCQFVVITLAHLLRLLLHHHLHFLQLFHWIPLVDSFASFTATSTHSANYQPITWSIKTICSFDSVYFTRRRSHNLPYRSARLLRRNVWDFVDHRHPTLPHCRPLAAFVCVSFSCSGTKL